MADRRILLLVLFGLVLDVSSVQYPDSFGRFVPSHQLEEHLGYSTNATFSIEVQDILKRAIDGKIPYKKLIRLLITMTPGSDEENGFTVKHCDALNANGFKYRFLTAGCGDGYVLQGSQGFSTSGLTSASPYFRFFVLEGSDAVSFECSFVTCGQACDGTSCNRLYRGRRRRKRTPTDAKLLEGTLDEEHTVESSTFLADEQNKYSEENKQILRQKDVTGENKSNQSSNLPTKLQRKQSSFKSQGKLFKSPPISIDASHLKQFRKYVSSAEREQTTDISTNNAPSTEKTERPEITMDSGNWKTEWTNEQKTALIGCIVFLVMVTLFVCVTFYFTRQKNKFERKFWAVRASENQSGARAYLLDDME